LNDSYFRSITLQLIDGKSQVLQNSLYYYAELNEFAELSARSDSCKTFVMNICIQNPIEPEHPSMKKKNLASVRFRRVSAQVTKFIVALGTVGLAICFVILLGLSWLFQEVWEKEAFSFDTTILLKIHRLANPVLDQLMLSITRLGNPEVAVCMVGATFIWLWWKHRRIEAKMFAIASLGAVILNQGLKLFFEKPRPILWPRLITETSFSFPSGHALGSLVIGGFLAYLLASQFQRAAVAIYGGAIALIAAIGFSRLYLGVHWPTDIISGYGVGFLWLMTCITLLKMQLQPSPTIQNLSRKL
jgi:membrane-associated phospholipid phosphatase